MTYQPKVTSPQPKVAAVRPKSVAAATWPRRTAMGGFAAPPQQCRMICAALPHDLAALPRIMQHCHGSCSTATDLASTATDHAAMLQDHAAMLRRLCGTAAAICSSAASPRSIPCRTATCSAAAAVQGGSPRSIPCCTAYVQCGTLGWDVTLVW